MAISSKIPPRDTRTKTSDKLASVHPAKLIVVVATAR